MAIIAIDRNQVIPTLEEALAKAKRGEVTHAYVMLCIDGEITNYMCESESKYEDAGILLDTLLERLGYLPVDEDDE